ncbi:MAG: AAA family ATPase, partial [Chloroflexales bacterium]|nr:AAA family ATPase [Chloroflexales bacterium]
MSTDSAAPLLHTKLTPPPLRRTLLRRDRLCALLDQGLAEPHRLTLISAPAGAGKTTLVTAWLQALPGPARVAWLAVDARDNDPARFLGYLVAALQRVDPALGQRAQSLLGTPQLPPLPTIVAELINDLAALSAPILLVLDDYHAITSAPVHAALDHLIDYQPAALHLVIATREDPPLPLARLRARGQLTELRAQELGFTSEEARDFFQQALGLDLDAATVAGLAERTEGWAAGLHLAGLALQRQPDPQAFVATFTGTHRYIIEYLLDEVLRGLTPELRAFLGHTAVLARFNAELCQVVTGNPAAAAILAELERANLFVTALDDRHGWYRYHQLFAEALRATLAPAAERAVQVAAARWFAAQGLLAEAIP